MTMAGGPATPLAARDTAPLPEGVRAADDVGLTGGDDGRKACDAVGRARHGASPGRGEGRRRRRPHGRRWRRWQEAERATAPLPEGVRAGDDVDLTGGGGDDGRRACDAPRRLARRG